MTDYRRNFIAGGSFFFTVNLADRRLLLLTEYIDELRVAFHEVRQRHPFTTDALVVPPDHLHAVWRLPDGDADFSMRWRQIKSVFSRKLLFGEPISPSRSVKGERGIWQRRYWEHTIRDEDDFARHIDYVHINPVKHALVGRVRDWPYSIVPSNGEAWCLSGRLGGTWRGASRGLRRAFLMWPSNGFRFALPILRR